MALHHSADPAWGEYLVLKFGRNRPNYKVIVMAGHSQGGAHAGYIASQQTLAGLLAFSGPFPETIDHDPNTTARTVAATARASPSPTTTALTSSGSTRSGSTSWTAMREPAVSP